MKSFGFRKMDEMELQISLRSCRAAWVFLVIALFLWEAWELIRGGDTNLPAFLLGAQMVIFCLAQWIGRVRAGCWGVLAGVGMLLFDQLLMHALASAGIEIEAANEDVIRQTLGHAPVFGLVQIALIAPLVEELIFRQRLFGRFWRAGHPGWGVVVTSLLFATLHEFGVDAGQPWHAWLILMGLYAASGGFFAWLYWRSGRLQTPIVAHAINNLVLCVGMLWETAA